MRCVVSYGSPHFNGSYSSLQLRCEGVWLTSITGRWMWHGACLATERNAPVVQNWFQLCQCCCRPCHPGLYIGFGSRRIQLSPGTWSLWLSQASVCLLWSPCWCRWYCHQRGLLRTGLHAVGSEGVCRDAQLILPVFLSLLLSHHQPKHANQKNKWIMLCHCLRVKTVWSNSEYAKRGRG